MTGSLANTSPVAAWWYGRLALAADEVVDIVRLCQGKHNDKTRVFFSEATTSRGRTASTGKATDDCVTFAAPEAGGWGLVCLMGQDGDEIDQLALLWAPTA